MYILRDPREIWPALPAGRYVVGYEKTMIAGASNVQCLLCYSSYTMSIQGVSNFSDNKIRSNKYHTVVDLRSIITGPQGEL